MTTWIWNRILFLAPIQRNTHKCLGVPSCWSILTTPIICFSACEASNNVCLCVLWNIKHHIGRIHFRDSPQLVFLTFLNGGKDSYCSPIQYENLTETTAIIICWLTKIFASPSVNTYEQHKAYKTKIHPLLFCWHYQTFC